MSRHDLADPGEIRIDLGEDGWVVGVGAALTVRADSHQLPAPGAVARLPHQWCAAVTLQWKHV